MFKVKVLPARFGDSLWIEYGEEAAPHHVLIDGGTSGTRHEINKLLQSQAPNNQKLDLMVITHIDRDHIEGVLGILEENGNHLGVSDLWFNGWPHLPENPEDEVFGALQGERLTKRIVELGLPWNECFRKQAVVIEDTGPLNPITLDGGLQITLLSPTREALAKLRPVWKQEVRDANLDPGFGLEVNDAPEDDEEDQSFGAQDLPDVPSLGDSPFVEDRSEANASSIAFIAEFQGKRALFAADAHAGKLVKALERLAPRQRVALDLFKISHHGSKNTTSRELIEKVDCSTYLFSTNGSIFRHPHAEAVSRVLVAGKENPTLVFNYRSPTNEIWDHNSLKTRYHYRTRYPADGEEGIEIEL